MSPPVSLLLDDVLREIYLYVAPQDRPHQFPPSSDTSSDVSTRNTENRLGWIQLTHVSHQWREVGLNIPQLWAGIVHIFESTHAVKTVLQRARQSPLTIKVFPEDTNKRRCEIATSALHLASKLTWMALFKDSFSLPWATHLCGRDLPLLRHLCLHDQFEGLGSLHSLYRPLRAPLLETCSLSFDIPMVAPNLRELAYDGATQFSQQRLLTRLSGFPSLTYLYLGTLPDANGVDALPALPVSLPLLRYFACAGDCAITEASFLQRLSLPSSTTMLVRTAADSETTEAFSALMCSMRSQLRHLSRTALLLSKSGTDGSVVQVHSPKRSVSIFTNRHRHDLVMQEDGVAIDAGITRLPRILSPLLDIVGAHVTTLAVKAMNVAWNDDLTALLLSLHAVEELHVWNRTRRMLNVLAPRDSSEIVLPSLSRLVANFSDDVEDEIEDDWSNSDEESNTECACDHIEGWLSGLIPILQARARAGRRLQNLRIIGPITCWGVVKVTPEGSDG